MSYSVSTLLIRNLDQVFAENDPARRRAAIDEVFHEDVVYYDRSGTYRGRDEIQRIAGVYRGSHPELRFRRSAPPEDGRWRAAPMGVKPPQFCRIFHRN